MSSVDLSYTIDEQVLDYRDVIIKLTISLEDFIENELQTNQSLLEALRQIDQRQMFEKDDDVGSIFYQIKETIERFKQF